MTVTLEQFIETVGECDNTTFEVVIDRAKSKLAVIIERFGDENGARQTDDYFFRLMVEEYRSIRISEILFSTVCPPNKRKRPATA